MTETESNRLRNWQAITVGMLFVGYAGYYFCRSNLSVAMPLIIEELVSQGISPAEAKLQLGFMVSLGVLIYAFGKFVGGATADFVGGKTNFLFGMGGAIIFTCAFTFGGGIPFFTLAWIGNRFVQSFGWVGIVKVSTSWFKFSAYGTIMGIISLSFLLGDAAARKFMGMLIEDGMGWRGIFYSVAAILAVIFVGTIFILKNSPRDIGEEEPEANPLNLYAEEAKEERSGGLMEVLRPMLTNPAFLTVCFLSLVFTLVRETFNTWTPTYFVEAVHLTKSAAAEQSALFPLFGAASTVIAGYASDKIGVTGRALLILASLIFGGAALVFLGFGSEWLASGSPAAATADSEFWRVWVVALIAFIIIGPYSYLGGAIAMDFGGKKASGTACGIIDGIGYLGGFMAGDTVARISNKFGWEGAWTFLGVVTLAASLAAGFYLWTQIREIRERHLESIA